jgi:hypothetical protein
MEDYELQEVREQLMNRKDEEIKKSLDEAIKQLIDIIENDEQYISIEVKENLLMPIVNLTVTIKVQTIRENKSLASHLITNLEFEKVLKLLDNSLFDYSILHFSLQLVSQVRKE